MARVRLSADVPPELRRRVKIAAVTADQSVSEWVESVVRRELDRQQVEPTLDAAQDAAHDGARTG